MELYQQRRTQQPLQFWFKINVEQNQIDRVHSLLKSKLTHQCQRQMIFGKSIFHLFYSELDPVELRHLPCNHDCPKLTPTKFIIRKTDICFIKCNTFEINWLGIVISQLTIKPWLLEAASSIDFWKWQFKCRVIYTSQPIIIKVISSGYHKVNVQFFSNFPHLIHIEISVNT